jgi:hypothetical protein
MRGNLSFPIFHLPFSIEDRGRHFVILKMENGKWQMTNGTQKWTMMAHATENDAHFVLVDVDVAAL